MASVYYIVILMNDKETIIQMTFSSNWLKFIKVNPVFFRLFIRWIINIHARQIIFTNINEIIIIYSNEYK